MANYWLGVMGAWIISDGIYSWVLYANSQAWRGQRQTFLKDHWIRLLRIIMGAMIVALGVM